MVLRDGQRLLQGQGGFDKGGGEPRVEMPLDVAVEEPDAWIVCHEPQDHEAQWIDHRGVSAHRDRGKIRVRDVGVGEEAGVFLGAIHGLEVVPVQVEGVFACVVVVDDDLDDLPLGEHKRVRIGAVHGYVCSQLAGAEGCVQGRYFGGFVGDVVEEGTVTGVCQSDRTREEKRQEVWI